MSTRRPAIRWCSSTFKPRIAHQLGAGSRGKRWLTADALRLAAQEYARSDAEARGALQDLMRTDYMTDGNGKRRDIPNIELPL
ncbi:hypothetical protein AAH979_33855 [Plantactinospora sp. ZYX-F-223]|uniref:hypothetical protein n=1 Tax=Plantactinospora sp. ZYX-F-223 TaxID=3144103 RepID=UPI0031FBD9D5